jgi:cobalt-zinc-cadmium efflux system outer membrane protein
MIRILIAIVCLLAIFLGNSAAQQPSGTKTTSDKLTIEQAVDEAVRNNLVLLAERTKLPIAEASRITAGLRPNPLFSFGGDHINPATINNPQAEMSLRIDVPIETGDKRQRRLAVAEYDKAIAEAQLLDAIRKLKLEVSRGCLDLLQAKAQLQIAVDTVRLLNELVRLNETRVQEGSIIPLELARLRVSMFQFRNDVRRGELNLITAKAKLQALLGRKTSSNDFDILGELKGPMIGSGLELGALVELALATRPDLVALERQTERAQSDIKLQLAQAKVDYSVGTEYRRQGFNGGANTLGVFFSVPIPLFNRNQGEIARVTAEHEQLARQLQARRLEITVEVKTAYEEFRSVRTLVESIQQELLSAVDQARSISIYLYSTEASTLTDFLDTQRAFNETLLSYYQAEADYRRSLIQLNASIGKEIVQH